MKKIGILFGQEHSFPPAFVDRVNTKTGGKDVQAEFVRIDKVIQGEPCGYDVVIDRISQDVPFYRAWLKNAALTGTAVVNNPFWWSADEKFFNNALATKIGVAVPRTVLLPSHELPPDTNDKSFRNLAYPLDWEGIFDYVGWPAFFKPFAGGGWKNVYRVAQSGGILPRLQRDRPARHDVAGGSEVRHVLPLLLDRSAQRPHHAVRTAASISSALSNRMAGAERDSAKRSNKACSTLNQYLGYDLNTVEFAIRDGVPVAIDFCNPAPDAEVASVGQANFEWVVEAVSDMAIRKAREHVPGRDN